MLSWIRLSGDNRRFEVEEEMSTSRRTFLRTLGHTSAALWCVPWGGKISRAATVPANERITLGFIGLGSHGINMNLKSFIGHADTQVVALCDVDARHLHEAEQLVRDTYADKGKGRGNGLFLTRDLRELVIRDDIDAVIVSTPDHWHVLASLWAIRHGKDVYCEKPLSRTVAEGRVLSDETARFSRIFQTGSEFRGTYNFHRAAELVRNGYIGELKEMDVYLPRNPVFPGDPQPMPAPKELDYEMWLGPAPAAPYTVDRVHFNYRWILDYSVGMLADWGGHLLDQAQWAVNREYSGPVSVQATGRFLTEGLFDTAVDFKVEYEYDNGVRLVCDDRHPEWSGGIRYIGSEGEITARYAGYKGRDITATPASLLRIPIRPDDHHLYTCPEGPERNFLDCVKSRTTTYYPAEVGHRSATVCHLGHIAMLLGELLYWDSEKEQFINNERANRHLSRAMRSPWHL